MASTTTAESAAADNVSKSRLLDFERVLALVGDRGFRFESGDLKLTVFPASICGLLSSLSSHRNELSSTRVCRVGVVWRLGTSNWVT